MTLNEYMQAKNIDKAKYNSFFEIVGGGYRITAWYRRCQLLQGKKGCKLLSILCRLWYNHLCVKYGCDIPSNAKIGAGLKLVHTVGIVVNSKTIIGENCTIKSGAVFGVNHTGTPTVGNNVSIGVHALIIGGIHIGNNAEIGAGAIVTHDVPDGGVVYGEASTVRRIKDATEVEYR